MELPLSQSRSPKYPDIFVQLDGEDGNAGLILGKIMRAMRKAKIADSEIQKFRKEATSGDYDHLLQVCDQWVNVG